MGEMVSPDGAREVGEEPGWLKDAKEVYPKAYDTLKDSRGNEILRTRFGGERLIPLSPIFLTQKGVYQIRQRDGDWRQIDARGLPADEVMVMIGEIENPKGWRFDGGGWVDLERRKGKRPFEGRKLDVVVNRDHGELLRHVLRGGQKEATSL
ncbi:hypothetical protein A2994_03955 [candidate division Kazan bacterium RIFCSPLOWO2_01_FULL_48_13]|uniref:Uncharacterized protein n=1 Tax=candidate division Kazan bacterium RIFCSPLOWO2_01_FULL_48_13 TaxID=1798539 RepID=A0A1F4PMS4_UNCK3|nr:MAG: hypothetical protein A2994_03955 [candidate division Kazan bacterium RIFCSPLOWO2_01_FULL_48_13]